MSRTIDVYAYLYFERSDWDNAAVNAEVFARFAPIKTGYIQRISAIKYD